MGRQLAAWLAATRCVLVPPPAASPIGAGRSSTHMGGCWRFLCATGQRWRVPCLRYLTPSRGGRSPCAPSGQVLGDGAACWGCCWLRVAGALIPARFKIAALARGEVPAFPLSGCPSGKGRPAPHCNPSACSYMRLTLTSAGRAGYLLARRHRLSLCRAMGRYRTHALIHRPRGQSTPPLM